MLAPPAHSTHSDAWTDASISMEQANRIAARVVLPGAALLAAVPWLLLHGRPLSAWVGGLHLSAGGVARGAVVVVGAMLLSIVVHEALHALGIRIFARKPWRSIHYGFDRETLSPYVGCTEPMPARAYRGWAALPCVVLGVVPLACGLAAGTGGLVLFGFYNLAAAGGDLAVLWAIRRVPGDAWVLDHPHRAGCRVLRPRSALRSADPAR
jgi:hypothetical protein